MMKKIVFGLVAFAMLLTGVGLAQSHNSGSVDKNRPGLVQESSNEKVSYKCGKNAEFTITVLEGSVIEFAGSRYVPKIPYREDDGMICFKEVNAVEKEDCAISISWKLTKRFTEGKMQLGKKFYDCEMKR